MRGRQITRQTIADRVAAGIPRDVAHKRMTHIAAETGRSAYYWKHRISCVRKRGEQREQKSSNA